MLTVRWNNDVYPHCRNGFRYFYVGEGHKLKHQKIRRVEGNIDVLQSGRSYFALSEDEITCRNRTFYRLPVSKLEK